MLNFCTALFFYNKKWTICLSFLVLILQTLNITPTHASKSLSEGQYPLDRLKPEMRFARAIGTEANNYQNQKLYYKNLEQHASLSKRAALGDIGNDEDKRLTKGYQKYKRRRSPLAIVYIDRKPIGILEPISREYEYQNFQDNSNFNPLYKRNNLESPTEGDYNIQRELDTDKYTKLLNNNPSFDDDPYLEEGNTAKMQRKRHVDIIQEKASLPRQDSSNGDKKLSAIEDNLKEIISDLNTINEEDDDSDDIDKREIQSEDEDLDNGVNKIDISKESHVKRQTDVPKSEASPLVAKETKKVEERSSNDHAKKLNEGNKIADYRSEGEKYIRSKRQQVNTAINRNEGNDIVKGLEASGDLTVSGNKSPLASASAPVETENKKVNSGDYEKRDKQAADDGEYEKRLQRNIQTKISEIKEQVKREIKEIKTNANTESPNSSESSDKKRDAKTDPNLNQNSKVLPIKTSVRQKRNLLERENNAELDLVKNAEAEALIPHIRQRRKADSNVDSENSKEFETHRRSRPSLVQIQIGKGISKRQELDPNAKANQVKNSKRDNLSQASPLGFQANSNQDVAIKTVTDQPAVSGVLAKREIKQHALVSNTLDAEKLERLVRESASLTESIKSERGARYSDITPHIEVELHSSLHKGEVKEKPSDSQKRDDKESVSLVDNQAKPADSTASKDTPVDEKKRRNVRSSQSSNEKKFRESKDADAESKASIGEINEIAAISDSSAPSASEHHEHSFKAYEASNGRFSTEVTKMGDVTPSVSSEAKTIEIRTNSPESARLVAEESNSVNADESKSDKMKTEKNSAKINDDAESNDSENEDLNKRSPGGITQETENKLANDESKVRQERKSEPELSLEDMQELDSENKMRRKRRSDDDYYDSPREKRSQYPLPNYLRYRRYRGDEDEADDESDEFDDDNFDDRTANIVRKRDTDEQDNYDDLDEDYEPLSTNKEGAIANRVNKRNTNARALVEQMNNDVYDDSNYLYDANGHPLNRNKRQVFDSSSGHQGIAALHGGGPMIRHLVAIKDRNARFDNSRRRKRLGKNAKLNSSNKNKNQIISGLTENDIFGALPQSYEGELTRFKRVKRDDPSVDHAVASV